MKLVSWNVNGIRACHKKGLREFLEKEKPDVFCVQETKAKPEQLKEELYTDLFPYSQWSSSQVRAGYSGTAVLANTPFLNSSTGINIEKYDQEGRFVITRFREFLLYNIYFPNGAARQERHDYKQSFLKDLYDHLAEHIAGGEAIMVVGDYNIAHLQQDVHDPIRLSKVSGFLPEERDWMTEFFDLGFVDLYRHFYPEAKDKYTWWSYRETARLRNKGWRIDYISVTENLLPSIKSMNHLDQQHGSDHCPLVVELNL